MSTFVALYRGATVADARLVAVSADPEIVADLSARLLQTGPADDGDPVVENLERGRRAALKLIRREAKHASPA
jgi:hypothetical protein